MREEVVRVVTENNIWDDLLELRIVLHLGARLEKVLLADHRLVTFEIFAHEAMPRAVGKHVFPLDAQDPL